MRGGRLGLASIATASRYVFPAAGALPATFRSTSFVLVVSKLKSNEAGSSVGCRASPPAAREGAG